MTKRPQTMLGRLDREAHDALSDALRSVRFARAIYYTVNVGGPWPPIQVPAGPHLAPAFGTNVGNVLSYHVVTEGSCWTGLESGEPVKLEVGDIVVYPHGDPYFLAPDVGPRAGADVPRLVGLLQGVSSGMVPPAIHVGTPDADVRFVCGFLGCDARVFDPLLRALPPILHVRAAGERLSQLVQLAIAEVDGTPGADSVRERLCESMFIETVRQHLVNVAADQIGLVAGLRDDIVGRSLGLLHAHPARPWTLASLAKETGASRSALAARFAKLVGHPPMQYLTQWRMQLAAHLLRQRDAKVSGVALEVGYDSEAAFSRAFKKVAGVSPAIWRSSRIS